MRLFNLGTRPLAVAVGAARSVIGKKSTPKVMAVGAISIVVFSLAMLSQGWSLSESASSPARSNNTVGGAVEADVAVLQGNVQIVRSTLAAGKYPDITVRVGTPVKWVINAPEGSITGCNKKMILPEYVIEHEFNAGENVIEFTPTDVGSFKYTCWMNMLSGTIKVVKAG